MRFCPAQTVWPYRLSKPMEIGLLGGGIATNITGLILQSRMEGLTPAEISALDPNSIHAFDRLATMQHSKLANSLSYGMPVLAGAADAALLLDSTHRRHIPELLLMGGEGALLTLGINQTVKAAVQRTRPYVYNPTFSWEEKGKKDARLSFFSQHTSLTGYFSFFAAKAYHDTHPHSRLRWLPWAGAGALTAATGYARVKAGKHFPTDVIVGGAFGALMGWGVLELHRKGSGSSSRTSEVSFFPVGNGVGVEWLF